MPPARASTILAPKASVRIASWQLARRGGPEERSRGAASTDTATLSRLRTYPGLSQSTDRTRRLATKRNGQHRFVGRRRPALPPVVTLYSLVLRERRGNFQLAVDWPPLPLRYLGRLLWEIREVGETGEVQEMQAAKACVLC